MPIFGIETQSDRNGQMLTELLRVTRDLVRRVASIESRQGAIMSNQEKANEIAANIAADAEVIAKAVDSLNAALANERAARSDLESQLAAAGVDFTALHEAEATVDHIAGVLNTALNPAEPTPPVEEVPTVEPVEEPTAPVDEAPAEAPVEDSVIEPAPEVPADADSEASDPAAAPATDETGGSEDAGSAGGSEGAGGTEGSASAPEAGSEVPVEETEPAAPAVDVPPVEVAPGEEAPVTEETSGTEGDGTTPSA